MMHSRINFTPFDNSDFSGIDWAKFIFSFFVMAIHFHPFETYSHTIGYWIEEYVARIAVPFFFITSGFFCFRKMDLHSFSFHDIKHYIGRILILYLCWSVFYLPGEIHYLLNCNYTFFKSLLALLHGFVLGRWATQLWYLVSLISSVAITSLFLKLKTQPKRILFFALVFFILGHINQLFLINQFVSPTSILYPINHAFVQLIITPRNGLFFGFVYCSLGLCISKKEIGVVPVKKAFLGFVISMILFLGEIITRSKIFHFLFYNGMSLFILPAAYYLFCILSQLHIHLRIHSMTIRQYSTLIYCSHTLIASVVSFVIRNIGLSISNSLLMYIIFCFLSLLFAIVVVRLSKKKAFKVLSFLY